MMTSDEPQDALQQLLRTTSPARQAELRAQLPEDRYYGLIRGVYLNNPFFKLTDDELAHFRDKRDAGPVEQLILLRDAASKTATPKISVFCMPKSGSSFVKSALQYALDLPSVSITSVANPGASSFFGMNAREQELDELALVKVILDAERGFVAQNHTRCSMYLANQLAFYGVQPILTVRNVLDCVVSFDDMMLSWRAGKGRQGWVNDTPFSIPANYPELDEQTRYRIIAPSYGVWLIAFYLSWKRCVDGKFLNPLVLQYEADVLNPESLLAKLTGRFTFADDQKARLESYLRQPDQRRSRLNVGVKGRGRQKIDPATVEFLAAYAENFRGELSDKEIRYLIG